MHRSQILVTTRHGLLGLTRKETRVCRNGRRGGLKNRCPLGRVGSNPITRTVEGIGHA